MNEHSYSGIGILYLSEVTPVIQALFGSHGLQEQQQGQVAIALTTTKGEPRWSDIHRALDRLIREFGIAGPASECPPTLQDCLNVLGCRLCAHRLAELQALIDNEQPASVPDLETLFRLACLLDDGHGLRAIKHESSWRDSHSAGFHVGGRGAFVSREVVDFSHSSRARVLGEGLYKAVRQRDSDEALNILKFQVDSVISQIQEAGLRRRLRMQIADWLQSEWQHKTMPRQLRGQHKVQAITKRQQA